MRARLFALLMAGATVFAASPGTPQDWTASRSPQIATESIIASLPQLAERIPDGAGLIDLYKAARTVTDVEAANGQVKGLGRCGAIAWITFSSSAHDICGEFWPRSRYYNETRTHLSLGKDAPSSRAIQRYGAIVTTPILSGLHHCYARI